MIVVSVALFRRSVTAVAPPKPEPLRVSVSVSPRAPLAGVTAVTTGATATAVSPAAANAAGGPSATWRLTALAATKGVAGGSATATLTVAATLWFTVRTSATPTLIARAVRKTGWGGEIVTAAEAVSVESSLWIAVTVTIDGVAAVAGAV